MNNFKIHGKTLFNIVVVHGGPGAIGGMAPVARKLSKQCGVLELLQTKTSINEQIEELKNALKENASLPVILIGHSWGAWLSVIFATQYPSYVKKLILVSSAPFKEKYAENIMQTRLERLNEKDKRQVKFIMEKFNDLSTTNEEINCFNKFIAEMDSYHPAFYEEGQTFDIEIFRKVWGEAVRLRKNGKLLKLCYGIKCPVVAIHGDYDPHPYQGVQKPLSAIIKNFKFMLLKKCGHTPWIEKEAKDEFYKVLEAEIF